MNRNVFSQLAAEFDRMERTINYQKEVIASMQKPPVCPCCKVPADGRIYGIPDLPKMKLDDCSWAEIDMYGKSGMADKVFSLGDTKTVQLKDGTTIHVRIIGFNHDRDKHSNILPISFETVETLNDDFQMNPEYTNKGGWQNSQLRKMLNNSIIELLPDDLLSVIKPCLKETSPSRRFLAGRFTLSVEKASGMTGIVRRIPNTGSASRTVSGIGGGGVRLLATAPAVSAMCTPRVAPAVTTPAARMVCPSASAFNPKSCIIPPRKGR